jgi:hypothetical protein
LMVKHSVLRSEKVLGLNLLMALQTP